VKQYDCGHRAILYYAFTNWGCPKCQLADRAKRLAETDAGRCPWRRCPRSVDAAVRPPTCYSRIGRETWPRASPLKSSGTQESEARSQLPGAASLGIGGCRKGLEPRGVRRERELSVAHAQRRSRVDPVQRGVVARDHYAAIDASLCCTLRGQRGGNGAQKGAAGYRHASRLIPFVTPR